MRIRPCKSCHGQRLKPSSLAVTIADKNIYQITDMSIVKLKTAASSLARNNAAPISSSGLPNLPIGVPATIFLALSVYVPSSLNNNA